MLNRTTLRLTKWCRLNSRKLILASLLAATLLLLIFFSLKALDHIIHFNGYAANGAFQLMNPLLRLDHGEIIGRDFPFFHGAGVLLIHYPLFVIFGGGLFGSEMSRWFTSIFIFSVVTLVFSLTWTRSKHKKHDWIKVLSLFLLIFLGSAWFIDVITPTNSLLGIRTSVPIMVAALLLSKDFLIKRGLHIGGHRIASLYHVLIGPTLALAIICGTEHGIAASLAYVFLEAFDVYAKRKKEKTLSLVYNLASRTLAIATYTVISLISIATVVSWGHPIKLLKYNIITVANDQFWYFGAEPQGFLTVGSFWQSVSSPAMIGIYLVTLAAILAVYFARRYSITTPTQSRVLWFLLAYGIITLGSLIGYFTPQSQNTALIRVTVIIMASIVFQFTVSRVKLSSIRYWVVGPILISAVAIVYSFTNMIPLPINQLLKDTYQNVSGNHTSLLGSDWTQRTNEFSQAITQAKKNSQYPLWSTYASLYNEQNGITQPSSDGCDYIIHCLGKDMRNQYTQDFIRSSPELVTTLRPSYFGFEEWLWGRHAEFYEYLVTHYDVLQKNDAHILWKRRSLIIPSLQLSRDLTVDDKQIQLPNSKDAGSRIIKVTVAYDTDPLYSKIPSVNKLPRYILHPNNTSSFIGISLPPTEHEWSFLIVLNQYPDSTNQFMTYDAEGLLPKSDMSVRSAKYVPIFATNDQLAYFTELSAFLKK